MKKSMLMTAVAGACLWAASSFAFSIDDPGVVGTMKPGSPDSIDGSTPNEVIYANQLLSMAANDSKSVSFGTPPAHDPYTFLTGAQNGVPSHSGVTVSAVGAFQTTGTGDVPAGYDWVLAKYGGSDNGYVLWYLGGAAGSIPTKIDDYFGNGGGLSHFTVFNSVTVPDGGTTVLLLGSALSLLGIVRRKLS